MVSHDCGISYHPDHSAETVEALEDRMRELDAQGLRWGLDEDGVPVHSVACKIHRDLLGFVQQLNKQNAETAQVPDGGR